MTDEQEMTEQQQQLWERIEGVRPTMMTTIAADGAIHSRPMWTQGDAFDGSLWFFASRQSALADELVHDPRVALSYAAPDKDLYVSVSGQAELVLDRVKAEEMWSVFAEAWFPDGVDDREPRPRARRRRAGPGTGRTTSRRCSSSPRSCSARSATGRRGAARKSTSPSRAMPRAVGRRRRNSRGPL